MHAGRMLFHHQQVCLEGHFKESESDVTRPRMVTHFLNSHSAFTYPIHYLRVAPYLTLDRSEIKAVMIEGQRI